MPLHALVEDNLAVASPGPLRAMVKTFTDALMSAEADAVCGAEYGQAGAAGAVAAFGARSWGCEASVPTTDLRCAVGGLQLNVRTPEPIRPMHKSIAIVPLVHQWS
ncbi:hypothetical protein ACFVYV_51415 [Streptomyces mirabilis]|uniref:hypothetical protein n=1 Tax=Streptomyces mirabilis TaxID=68239 RepID=UPI0036D8BE76